MILITDDDNDLVQNCALILEAEGYEVKVARSGAQALASITSRTPDLLISDCCMPDMSGPKLAEMLRAGPISTHFPILLMSGSMQFASTGQAAFEGFLRKPFLAAQLLEQVTRLLPAKELLV